MAVESFNDRESVQGPVARTGSLGGSQPAGARPSATGTPSGVVQADGTASPRANPRTLRAAGNVTPAGKSRTIAQTFNAETV